MNTLSVCMIVRDEEELLPRCLDSLVLDGLPIYDELIIGIDSRSTDRTEEVAKAYGAKIIRLVWPEDRDFSWARNTVEQEATGTYIYVQDADEVLNRGHERILEIVREGVVSSARPLIVFSRDADGNRCVAYPRQDVLHKKGSHVWKGKLHEWTEGPVGKVELGIEVEQIERPGGDRPHGDTFGLLRSNLSEGDPWQQRHVFYLLREHAAVEGHEHEGIALAEALLAHCENTSNIERSHACLLAAECWVRLGEPAEARKWYIRSIEEWAAWAEPYYALGVFCLEIAARHREEGAPDAVVMALQVEGIGWLYACAQHNPPSYFVDMTLYEYRRYQALAVGLARMNRLSEARVWIQRAIAGNPQNKELQDNFAAIDAELARQGASKTELVRT